MRKARLGVRLSGRGGQGVMLAGAIFATAAMHDGRHVVETPTYGPAARLGAAKVEIVLSDEEIAFPAVEKADLLLCLSRDAYLKYGHAITPGALVVVEETALPPPADLTEDLPPGLVRLPLRAVARELGAEMVTNVVALGALCRLSEAVSSKSLELAVAEATRDKGDLRELNRRALQAGLKLGTPAA